MLVITAQVLLAIAVARDVTPCRLEYENLCPLQYFRLSWQILPASEIYGAFNHLMNCQIIFTFPDRVPNVFLSAAGITPAAQYGRLWVCGHSPLFSQGWAPQVDDASTLVHNLDR